jgi:hypothetical protein
MLPDNGKIHLCELNCRAFFALTPFAGICQLFLQKKKAGVSHPDLLEFCTDLLYAVERDGQPGFFAVGGGTRQRTRFDRFVKSGVKAGQQLGGFGLFAAGDQFAVIFFQTAQV